MCPLDWGRQSVLQGGSGKTSSVVVWPSSLSSCPHRVDRASTLRSLAGRAGSMHSALLSGNLGVPGEGPAL